MRKKIINLISILLLIPLFSACDGSDVEPTTDPLTSIYTSVAETMAAEASGIGAINTPLPTSALLIADMTPSATPDTSVTPAPTSAVVVNSANCENSAYVSDVTYADGSYVYPGLAFTKTWLLQNTGTCSWTSSYQVVYVSGSQMSGSTTYVGITVDPGKQIQVSVSLVAPTTEGTYIGYWRLANESGSVFGATFNVNVVSSTNAETLTPTVTSTGSTSTSTSTTVASTSTTTPTIESTATEVPTTDDTTAEDSSSG